MASITRILQNPTENLASDLNKKMRASDLTGIGKLIQERQDNSSEFESATRKIEIMKDSFSNSIIEQNKAISQLDSKSVQPMRGLLRKMNNDRTTDFNNKLKPLEEFTLKANLVSVQTLFRKKPDEYKKQIKKLEQKYSTETIAIVRFLAEVSGRPAEEHEPGSIKPVFGSSNYEVYQSIGDRDL